MIASPQRLDILKILNIKGPLTYSALKTLAGFKSKKESGKFAYHLRKLVRQLLIQLNRQERKYTVTNLGRLVLNLTRQIEEQSLVESGKLYVRTSRQTMEEFNADRILQSLVKEAGMPVELAQKITSETESRLYKFQTQYLTAPLIREMVNALLVEHNLEEYRHKLTRLGMPIYDVTQLLNKAGDDGSDVDSLIKQTGSAVFSEYLLLEQLPRDVADAHLAGDMHLSNAGSWGLTPDTVFVDLLTVKASGFNPKGRLLYAPMLRSPDNMDGAFTILENISSLLWKEASVEIVYRNFLQYLAPFTRSKPKRDLEFALRQFFSVVSTILPVWEKPAVTLELDPQQHEEAGKEATDKLFEATLDAYRTFIEETPRPEIRLLVSKPSSSTQTDVLKQCAAILHGGGRLAFDTPGAKRSFLGISSDVLPQELQGDYVSVLHNLSLNLPRLAYDSNQDETYFRAKLAMLIGIASDALTTRRQVLERVIKKGLLPILSFGSDVVNVQAMPLIMNMVGFEETLSNLTKDASPEVRTSLAEKIVHTASQVAAEKAGKNERLGVAIVEDDGAARLASLDGEKYGKANLQSLQNEAYSHAPKLTMADLQDKNRVDHVRKLSSGLSGGLSVRLDASSLDTREIYNLLTSAIDKLPFFKVDRMTSVCRNCGYKLTPEAGRCKRCRSTASVQYSTAG